MLQLSLALMAYLVDRSSCKVCIQIRATLTMPDVRYSFGKPNCGLERVVLL